MSSALAADVERLSLVAGAVPVQGPAFVVTVDDAPTTGDQASGPDPRAGSAGSDGQVIARDLQILTNSLWEAGAEAVSINGQRLTTTASIRFAGEALLVDYRPSTSLFADAIGDPVRRRPRSRTGNGGHLPLDAQELLRDSHGDAFAMMSRPASSTLRTGQRYPPLRSTFRNAVTGIGVEETRRDSRSGLVVGTSSACCCSRSPARLHPTFHRGRRGLDAVFVAVLAVLDGIFNERCLHLFLSTSCRGLHRLPR